MGLPNHFNDRNPFTVMDLQDEPELANFFERRVSAYRIGVEGEVDLAATF